MCHTIYNSEKGGYSHFFLSSLRYRDWLAGTKLFSNYNNELRPLIQDKNVVYYERNNFVTCRNSVRSQTTIFTFNTVSQDIHGGPRDTEYLRVKNQQVRAGIHISPFATLRGLKEGEFVLLPGAYNLKSIVKGQAKSPVIHLVSMIMFRMSDVVFYDGHDVSVEQFVPIEFPKEITKESLLKHFEKQLERRENGKQVVDPRFLQK